MQAVCCAFAFALANAGNSRLAKIAMMAMTTSNSISVNAGRLRSRPPNPHFVLFIKGGVELISFNSNSKAPGSNSSIAMALF